MSITVVVALADQTNKQNQCGTGEECDELRLRRGSSLACGGMCLASSSSVDGGQRLVGGLFINFDTLSKHTRNTKEGEIK